MNLKNSMLIKISHMHNTTYFIIVFIRKTQKSKSIEKKSQLMIAWKQELRKRIDYRHSFFEVMGMF